MNKYDPNKQYKWEETDKFVFNGNQFGLLLNTLRNVISTPEAQQILLAAKAETEMSKILSEAVENGIVKEVKPEVKPEVTEESGPSQEKLPEKISRKASDAALPNKKATRSPLKKVKS
jgi:hypothetical protein